jgi:hypothetical protein
MKTLTLILSLLLFTSVEATNLKHHKTDQDQFKRQFAPVERAMMNNNSNSFAS